MNIESRETILYRERFEGDVSLIDGKAHVTEVSFPTAQVKNSVRIETETYVLKLKLTKRSITVWKEILDTIAQLLRVIPEKESKEIPKFTLKVDKKGKISVELLDGVHEFKHVSPGWFRSVDEVVTYDFFSA